MKRISPERKAAALAKLLPPYNMTVTAVAQMEGIAEATGGHRLGSEHWRLRQSDGTGCHAQISGKALRRQVTGHTGAVADGQRFSIYRA